MNPLIFSLPLLSALLLFLASPGPGVVILSWFSLVPLFFFLHRATPRRGFFLGWLAGTLYYLGMMYWVTISMETYGGLPRLLSISGLVLLAGYMGVYHGLFCAIISSVTRKDRAFPIWFAACLWVGLDYLRGIAFTGLPWMDMGYFHYNSSIKQLADLGGHQLLTFLVVLANGILYHFIPPRSQHQPSKQTGFALICLTLALLYPSFRLKQIRQAINRAPLVQTAVIQGNINQAVKWQSDNKRASINTHIALTNLALSHTPPPELVLWPETSLPFYPSFDPLFPQVQEETILQPGQSYELLCGAPHVVPKAKKKYDLYNAALLLSPDQNIQFYFKQHLVPFGEYVPLRSIFPFPKAIVQSIGDFTAGQHPAVLQAKRAKIGVLICIEAIYPDLARMEVEHGAEILANLTNDAWFGRSSAPTQHLAMTVFRAIENRRSLARSANTGISALILPTGDILESSELFSETNLVQPLPILTTTTIFTRFGHYFGLLCLLGAFAFFIQLRRRKAIDG